MKCLTGKENMEATKKQQKLTEDSFWEQPHIIQLQKDLDEKAFRLDYEEACLTVIAKLETLSAYLNRRIIDSMEWRVKSPKSCISKLFLKGKEPTMDNAVTRLNDIAGIRVVCNFLDDLYTVRNRIVNDPDFLFIKQKDYIKNPKSSGYQSLHLIMYVTSKNQQKMKVEIQLRTKAMDLWSDMEHHFIYKKEGIPNSDTEQALRKCAKAIFKIDKEMMNIRRQMEAQ